MPVKQEEKQEEAEDNGADLQTYDGDQDLDDDIDFNLGGNGNSYEAPPSHHESHGPGIKEDG